MRAPSLVRSSVLLGLGLTTLVAALSGPATAAPKKKPVKDDADDITAVKKDLVVLTDDDGNYYAMSGVWGDDNRVYFGDGKTMYALRVYGGGADGGTGQIDFSFWSPRAKGNASVNRDAHGDYKLFCGDDSYALKKAADPVAKKLLDTAAFKKPFWKRQAQALARDDAGNYYYVDRLRDEYGGKAHRIFAGPKGGMKELPMTNVVSDSVGEIYATKKGELRFVTSNSSAIWIKGATKTDLTIIPVEDNIGLIYGELGVYEGTLGTPCDDK
ncbi:MAG TPA: hypothetical protein VHE35_19070 [Kofleriaceae bacterium]|nr:hypothetical protein [Kofleriaceae bacterium]